jgi:hypothetical protein
MATPRRSRTVPSEAGPIVMILGTFTHEGLTAKIEALGFSYVSRNLRSSPKNWSSIAAQVRSLVDEGRLPIAFLYLSSPALLNLAEPVYDVVRDELLTELERTKTLVFVYEDALRGVVKPFPWEVSDDARSAEEDYSDFDWRSPFSKGALTQDEWLSRNERAIERARTLLTHLATRKVDLLPFRSRGDVTIRMFEALDDAQAGVFLRLYIPHGRYQSEQFEDFLTLFTRFLRDAEGREFSVDVQRTASGTAYLFKGRGEASTLDDLRAATDRFDAFLATAKVDPKAAERQLVANGTSREDASFIVAKYVRAANRLVLDSKHEFQRRHLALRQQMEADALGATETALLPQLDENPPSSLFSIVGNAGPLTIIVGDGAASRTTSIMAAEAILAGSITYTDQDQSILRRISEVEDKLRVVQLRSDLDRLKDPATTPEVRRTAVQRLKGFLYETSRYLGKKADEVGTAVLIGYLESLLKPPGAGS